MSRIVLLLLVGLLAAAEHPRLLFGAAELPALRARQRQEPYASILARIAAIAERDRQAWAQSDSAVNCAFLYAITGDDAWAGKARGFVERRLADTSDQPWGRRVKGLNLYMHGKSVALAYDFCHGAPSWTGFAAEVSRKLREQADLIFSDGGTEQNTDPASNWQANRWSSAALCYLACDEPYDARRLDDCFTRMQAWVVANYGTGAGARGWNIEGRGYQSYPWSHVGPWAIAARRLRGQDLRTASPSAVDHALWTVVAGAHRIGGEYAGEFAFHHDFGDDNPNGGSRAEGCWGLAFAFSPAELRPGLAWWYDRVKGAAGDRSWDSARAGAMYSYLFHPGAAVKPAPPLSLPAWRAACIDSEGNGMVLFRGRWLDGDDCSAALYAKLRGNRGHNGPDALGFRLIGHGTAWATGGGRYGPRIDGVEAYWRSQNSLYPVDPSTGALRDNGNRGELVGAPVVGAPVVGADGGGGVVARMAVTNLGVRDHTRRLLADYSAASGADAVWAVSDTSADGRFWQLCTLEANQLAAADGGFVITAPNGATLRATVLHPAAPVIATGRRQRGSPAGWEGKTYGQNGFVTVASEDGGYLVVLTAVAKGRAHPPVRSLAGTGAADGRRIAVGGLEIVVDGDRIAAGKARARGR